MNHLTAPMDIDLNGAWQFAVLQAGTPGGDYRRAADLEAAGLPLRPATVPGNLELDLQANGLLPDPLVGMNMLEVRAWEHSHVWYVRRFAAEPCAGFEARLCFEGIDCLADVYLNGELLGSTDNMLVEHGFDVGGRLKPHNELLVHVRPALEEARRFEYPATLSAQIGNLESLYIRKAPHMYGWDIMPRALSAGLWRPVRVRYVPVEHLASVVVDTLEVTPDLGKARLRCHYRAHLNGGPGDRYGMRVAGVCGDSGFDVTEPAVFDAGVLRFEVDHPKLWWPRGRGEPSLYEITVTLLKNGAAIDHVDLRHGIRTVDLRRTDTTDAAGSGEFCFVVNHERVFVLGTNWVPLDAFHSRDAQRLRPALALAVDIGCNMLRCWGGNVYESDAFFDACDRLGLMVWQDFAMACAVYPQDEVFARRLAAEARAVVRRLRQHPSLVLWSGDNECDQAYGWGGRRQDPNTNGLTRQVLPAVLREEDPGRPYLPSSPYVAPEAFRRGEDTLPENHLWGPRDYFKSPFYTTFNCHFASEIGYHGCPSPASIRAFISPGRVWPYADNPEWRLHGTSPQPEVHVFDYRIGLMANQVSELFGEIPGTLEEFAFASQATQAEAFKFFIERFRAGKWRRTGLIWWNLLDGWPQFSDAVVDYYYRRKLAYAAIRRSQQALCLVLAEPEGGEQALVACNDRREALAVDYVVRDALAGQDLVSGQGVAAGDATTILARVPASSVGRFYAIEWRSALGAGRNHYVAGPRPFDLAWYREGLRRAGLECGFMDGAD